MRLLFVNRFYWPETPATGQLLTDLAEAMAGRGHDVVVITSHPGAKEVPRRETRAGVEIHRVSSSRATSATIVAKAMDLLTFWCSALWRLFRISRPGGIIVVMTDPPLLGIGAWLIARLRGARLVHWVQDIYPEIAMELAGQRWLRVVRPLRNLAWRQADRCVTLGTDMAAVLEVAGVRAANLAVIPNWSPAGLSPATAAESAGLRAAWGLKDKFVVAYSGNLGRVHDLEPVLAAADALRADADIAFLFIGGGPQRLALEASAAQRGLPNIRFVPAQPRSLLGPALGVGDLHLVTLRPGCEDLVFPSKLYGIAAVHRPVLFIGPHDSEIGRLVRTTGLGDAKDRGDTHGIVAVIRRFATDSGEGRRCAANAERFAAAHDAPTAAARWATVLTPLEAC